MCPRGAFPGEEAAVRPSGPKTSRRVMSLDLQDLSKKVQRAGTSLSITLLCMSLERPSRSRLGESTRAQKKEQEEEEEEETTYAARDDL